MSAGPAARDFEETVVLDGEPLVLRPIAPTDEPYHAQFLAGLQLDDVYARFFNFRNQWTSQQLFDFTHIDYDKEMVFIAWREASSGAGAILGEAHVQWEDAEARFGIVVRSDFKGHGLGYLLLRKLIAHCRGRNLETLRGEVLAGNGAMLDLARGLGFALSPAREGVVAVTLTLA